MGRKDCNGDTIVETKDDTSFHAVKDDVINAGATYVSDESCVVDGNRHHCDIILLQSVLESTQEEKKKSVFDVDHTQVGKLGTACWVRHWILRLSSEWKETIGSYT